MPVIGGLIVVIGAAILVGRFDLASAWVAEQYASSESANYLRFAVYGAVFGVGARS
jgi:hypothetical protein